MSRSPIAALALLAFLAAAGNSCGGSQAGASDTTPEGCKRQAASAGCNEVAPTAAVAGDDDPAPARVLSTSKDTTMHESERTRTMPAPAPRPDPGPHAWNPPPVRGGHPPPRAGF